MRRRVLSALVPSACLPRAPLVPLLVVLLSASSVVRSMPPSARKKHNLTLRMTRKEGAKRARLELLTQEAHQEVRRVHTLVQVCAAVAALVAAPLVGRRGPPWSANTASETRFGDRVRPQRGDSKR